MFSVNNFITRDWNGDWGFKRKRKESKSNVFRTSIRDRVFSSLEPVTVVAYYTYPFPRLPWPCGSGGISWNWPLPETTRSASNRRRQNALCFYESWQNGAMSHQCLVPGSTPISIRKENYSIILSGDEQSVGDTERFSRHQIICSVNPIPWVGMWLFGGASIDFQFVFCLYIYKWRGACPRLFSALGTKFTHRRKNIKSLFQEHL